MASEGAEETVSEEGSYASRKQQLLQALTQQATSINALVALPLGTLQALADGESESFPLEQLLAWLQDLQHKSQENVRLSALVASLCTEGQSHLPQELQAAVPPPPPPPPPFYIVSLRGSCSWGEWLSTERGHFSELSTRTGPKPTSDHERWELHRVDQGLFALKSVAQEQWLASEPNGLVRCNRDQRDTWETWQLHACAPGPEQQPSIALRSHHGRFLCQEPPGYPTWNPVYWGSVCHRMSHNMLHVVADKPIAKEWETFTLTDGDGGCLPSGVWDEIKKSAMGA